MLLLLIIGW